jgi:pSer/pThr/pTyr-binding forkhead associated (FHA) protein
VPSAPSYPSAPAPQHAPQPQQAPPPRSAQPPQQAPPSARHRPAASVVVDQTNQRYELRVGSNVVGRGTDADLQLLDQGISRRHLDIQFDGNFATAYDLGSTNGTTVNGHEVGSHVLRHGDVIRVGHTRLVFHQEPV